MRPVPAVLPQVIVTVDQDGGARVSVDDVECPDGPVDRAQLGSVLASVAEAAGGPVRVEVREADGTCYADILTPQPRRPAAGEQRAAQTPAGAPVLRAEGFKPGETVLVAVLAMSIRADADGIVSLPSVPACPRRVEQLILFGCASRRTVRGRRTEDPRPRGWWRL